MQEKAVPLRRGIFCLNGHGHGQGKLAAQKTCSPVSLLGTPVFSL
jgi:hypothetical protein